MVIIKNLKNFLEWISSVVDSLEPYYSAFQMITIAGIVIAVIYTLLIVTLIYNGKNIRKQIHLKVFAAIALIFLLSGGLAVILDPNPNSFSGMEPIMESIKN